MAEPMSFTARANLILVGLVLLVVVFAASLFIPTQTCFADEVGECVRNEPLATIVTIALPLGFLTGLGAIALGIIGKRR